jgi:hypothetical protein
VLAPQSNGPWLDNTSEVKIYPEPGSITIDDLPEGMRKFGARMIERIEEAGRAPEPVYGVLDEVSPPSTSTPTASPPPSPRPDSSPPGLTPSAFKMCHFGSFTANLTKWLTTSGRGMCLIG